MNLNYRRAWPSTVTTFRTVELRIRQCQSCRGANIARIVEDVLGDVGCRDFCPGVAGHDGLRVVYGTSMRERRFLVLLVISTIIALTPLAQASPPDQTWIAGLYDNADYDDVVLSVTSSVGVVDSLTCRHTGFVQTVVAFIIPGEEGPVPTSSFGSASTRAPPSAA